MLISPKATDTIYQAVLHLLKQHGVEENEPLQQYVLLSDDIFLGYRFQVENLQVDWLAQHDILEVKTQGGKILLQKQLLSQKSMIPESTSCSDQNPVAA